MILKDTTSEVRNTLKALKKFYLCDSGIRYSILGSRNMNYGRVYENIVCIELLRRGYDVYVGKLYQRRSTLLLREVAKDLYSGQRQHFRTGNI